VLLEREEEAAEEAAAEGTEGTKGPTKRQLEAERKLRAAKRRRRVGEVFAPQVWHLIIHSVLRCYSVTVRYCVLYSLNIGTCIPCLLYCRLQAPCLPAWQRTQHPSVSEPNAPWLTCIFTLDVCRQTMP
jgi:hypothetical protein